MYYSLDQLMQIQLNILFQINICPTAFRLAITHRKYLKPCTNPPPHLTWLDGCADSKPNHPPTHSHHHHPHQQQQHRGGGGCGKRSQPASRVFATSHRVWMRMMPLLLLLLNEAMASRANPANQGHPARTREDEDHDSDVRLC